jgi:hypothetical protein
MNCRYLAAASGAFLLPLFACQSGQSGNALSGNGTGTSGFTGTGTGTAGSGGGVGPSGTISITINMPGASSVVASGTVLMVSAEVSVTGGTDYIDTSSVKVELTASGNTAPISTGVLTPDAAGGTSYSGSLSLASGLPTGAYDVTVNASSSGGKTASQTVSFEINAGPSLTVNSPLPGKHYTKSVVVEVVADAGMFGPLMSLDATVAGMPLTLADAGVPNTFRATVDFNSYHPPLVGDQLLIISATDNMNQTSEIRLVFNVDNTGPTITMTTPKAEDIVGGIVLFSALIQDPAGVLASSVIAVIGDDTSSAAFELALQPIGASTYGLLFDTAKLTKCPQPPVPGACILYPTVSFRASDELGNESALGYNFRLDNIGPVADLDPPPIRESRLEADASLPGGEGKVCSWKFDPLSPELYLGDDPHDGAVVPQVFDLRARIQDDGNAPPGTKLVPYSGVDPDNTSVYILDDTSQVLIVDTDGDGVCDDINPQLVPTTDPPTQNNQVLKIRLAPVMPRGEAVMVKDPSLPDAVSGCYPGANADAPPVLCFYQLPVAIGYAGASPAIWTLEPVDAKWCFGSQFDSLANNIQPGWACIAVRSLDLLGNRSVSEVLRVFITEDGQPPAGGIGTPPTCTGSYDMASNQVTAGSCVARNYKFKNTEICPLNQFTNTVDCALPGHDPPPQ